MAKRNTDNIVKEVLSRLGPLAKAVRVEPYPNRVPAGLDTTLDFGMPFEDVILMSDTTGFRLYANYSRASEGKLTVRYKRPTKFRCAWVIPLEPEKVEPESQG